MSIEREQWNGFSPHGDYKGDLFRFTLSVVKNSDGIYEVGSNITLSNDCKGDLEAKAQIATAIKEIGLTKVVSDLLSTYGRDKEYHPDVLATLPKDFIESDKITKGNINELLKELSQNKEDNKNE